MAASCWGSAAGWPALLPLVPRVLNACCLPPCAWQGLLAELYNTKDVKEAMVCVK